MKKRGYIFFIIALFLILMPFTSASSFGYNNPDLPKVGEEGLITIRNITIHNLNSSEYWDALDTPADIDGSLYNWVNFWNRSGTNVFLHHTGDKVGIGTTTPTHKLNVVGDANITGNITLGQKITFALGEIIDNIVDGWITITGSLNVTGNISTDSYFVGNGSFLTDVPPGSIDSYDTGWVACSDWTNQHLGTSVGGNVIHNLDAPLSDVLVKVLISTDGTDANSFEIPFATAEGGTFNHGLTIFQVDNDNMIVQTGQHGFRYSQDSDGITILINDEAWYYKIKVYKLT